MKTDHWVPAVIYAMLTAGAALTYWGVASAQSLKDPPRYNVTYGYSDRLVTAPSPKPIAVPFPTQRPPRVEDVLGEDRPLDMSKVSHTRVLFLKCSSYYTIMSKAKEQVAPLDAADARNRAIAAMRAAQDEGPAEDEDWIKTSDHLFLEVFEEYLQAPRRGYDLYDRYDAICASVTSPLITSKP